VILVLLIVFMITAPMLTSGIHVELPASASESPETQAPTVLQVTVDDDRIVYLEDEPVHTALLRERLQALAEARGAAAVHVRADARVEYGFVVKVLDAVQQAGIREVGLITRPSGRDEREEEDPGAGGGS
jgi:biopolymer transport protein TolR